MSEKKISQEERQKQRIKRRKLKDEKRRIILSKMPKNSICVEIGVWHGMFSSILLKELSPKHLYLIDPWAIQDQDKSLAGSHDINHMNKIHEMVVKKFKAEITAGSVSIIRDYSVPALKTFDNNSIDFAYVDGDHSFEGVLSDLNALFPKIKKNGIIMFDDYHQKGWWGDGVIRAINTFLGENPSNFRFKFIEGAQIAIEKITP